MHRYRGKSLVEKRKYLLYNEAMSKKLKILLVCGSGASTSFMAAKMRLAARDRGLVLDIAARSEGEISNFIGDVDAVMVGPHLSGDYETLLKTYGDECRIVLMEKDYYSKLDGKRAIEHLFEELKLK